MHEIAAPAFNVLDFSVLGHWVKHASLSPCLRTQTHPCTSNDKSDSFCMSALAHLHHECTQALLSVYLPSC